MVNRISRDECPRKHEKREKLNLKAQKMFGIIRDVYSKINRSKPQVVSPTCETIKVLKDHQIELEERKSEAVAYWYRYKAFSY